MNIEEFRIFCLSFADTAEKMPFGKFAARYDSLLVFYVLGHMFCIIDIDDFTYISIPATAEEISRLQDSHSDIGKPINRAMRNWITLPVNGSISYDELHDLVREAYNLIRIKHLPKPNKPRKTKA